MTTSGARLRELLIRRRQAGIEVRVLYDAIGSVTTPASFFEPMRQAGVEVLPFRPLNPTRTMPWKLNNRDHRKIVVVDGRIAFTGGINISGAYASASSSRPGPEAGREEAWRDTHVQIEGPVAAQFQKLFLETWQRAGGHVDGGSAQYFPPLAPSGAELVAAVATRGGDRNETTIYDTYAAAVGHASRRLWMTQAYFAPDAGTASGLDRRGRPRRRRAHHRAELQRLGTDLSTPRARTTTSCWPAACASTSSATRCCMPSRW